MREEGGRGGEEYKALVKSIKHWKSDKKPGV